MKLLVQIPCFNEEETLPQTVADIPRRIDGIDEVEILIVDDGSSDNTVAVAREAGVDHIVQHSGNRGLAEAFRTGIDTALRLGADIIVNTDADNQYCGQDIPVLISPLLSGDADIVVGNRQIASSPHFTRSKKLLQRFGSFVVRVLSGTDVPDAVSGFRAFSRSAAIKLNIVSTFSYTIESLIQAGRQKLRVASVPIRTNSTTRPSRLFRSIPRFVARSGATILRSFAMYYPLYVFSSISFGLVLIGSIPLFRFLYLFAIGQGSGHIQSLVVGGVITLLGGLAFLLGIIADLISNNRRLLETTLEKVRTIELHLISQGVHISSASTVEGIGNNERQSDRTSSCEMEFDTVGLIDDFTRARSLNDPVIRERPEID